MFRKLFCILTVVAAIVVVGFGIPVLAQDVCVTDYIANLAQPTTVAELRQYIDDLRDVLRECDPVADDVIEVDVLRSADFDEFHHDDYGCYAGVTYGQRTDGVLVYATVEGDGNANVLVELKEPGSKKFEEADEVDLKTFVDAPDTGYYRHVWDTTQFMPRGRYEFRYEAFVAADPITIAFDAEHNSVYRITIYCN